ncbi:MAG: sugar phosphate isomerase/epimerase [Clostridia bacterium]|nr:sugar phosphate isomerase/epimerase [Clostridia bacterium]
MIIGAQLYTVREQCQTESDLEATLAQVADIGYTTVQVSGIGPVAPTRVRQICDRLNLGIVVTHTAQDRILNDTEQVIEDHRIYGARHIGIGSMPGHYERNPDGIDRFLSDYRPAAEKIAAAGMQLHYHNHNFEFAIFDGQTLMQRLIDGMPPELLGFILDTYWLQAGGADPALMIRQLAGRVSVIHLKDMAMRGHDQIMTPVLSGNMNFKAILDACSVAGTEWLMVEQDTCDGEPIDCLAESYRNLAGLGYH